MEFMIYRFIIKSHYTPNGEKSQVPSYGDKPCVDIGDRGILKNRRQAPVLKDFLVFILSRTWQCYYRRFFVIALTVVCLHRF